MSARDMKRDATLVFEGTVTKVDRMDTGEFAATLKVSRVWKGRVADEQTVYVPDPGSRIGGISFKADTASDRR